MSRLRIRHETGFSYAAAATASYNEARMLPAMSQNQFVVSSTLEIDPVTSTQRYIDYWGTQVAAFDVHNPHEQLRITATSVVEVRPRTWPPLRTGWDVLADIIPTRLRYVELLEHSKRTRPNESIAELARGHQEAAETPHEAALAIATAVHDAVAYVPGSTGVHSTATEAWENKRGVCQDIAHITLGALRVIGIPARYVSGYLHPVPEAVIGTTVTGESHAWVEWFCGEGWHGFDPTNLIDVGERHVVVGRGRDYNDVSPLRGVYAGPDSSQLFVSVEITREA